MPELKQKPSALSHDEFIATYGGIYEHSPWIAEAALASGDVDTIDTLHTAMKAAVDAATHEQQMGLICAHPDLACAPADIEKLTQESNTEQEGAGLKACTPAEFAAFQQLNHDYRAKFGFPFIIAVRGLNRQDILKAFRARINNDAETEFKTALEQIHKIARLRLEAL